MILVNCPAFYICLVTGDIEVNSLQNHAPAGIPVCRKGKNGQVPHSGLPLAHWAAHYGARLGWLVIPTNRQPRWGHNYNGLLLQFGIGHFIPIYCVVNCYHPGMAPRNARHSDSRGWLKNTTCLYCVRYQLPPL
jgi:hypothetical protein